MPLSERIVEAPFTDVPGAVEEIRAGRMVVVVDDEDRENEGGLTLTEERADHLRLLPMTQHNSSRFGTAFTETIEAREGVTTGISAADRAHTIRVAIDPKSTSADLARPGHIFPLRARRGGVLVRAGQTEASVDLARLAGLNRSGVICEIMRDDGEMARIPDLIPFCKLHGLKMLTVAELIRYRLRHERYIVRAGETRIQTRYGEFRMIAYESEVNGGESHIALVRGDLCQDCPAYTDGPAGLPGAPLARTPCSRAVLVRVHTRCTAGDLFGADCHCREVIDQSLRMIAEEGCGALLYLHNTSRGFAIDNTPGDAFEPAARLPPQPRGTQAPAALSCTRSCGSARAHRTGPGASCAPSGWAGRSCPIWASSASACCRTRPCTSRRSKASAWRSSSRCTSLSRNAAGWAESSRVG